MTLDMENEIEIKNLNSSMQTVSKILKYLPTRDKKNRTIPQIFKKSFDENFISDFLAYILDPNYNGVGIEPLLRLVEENPNAIGILKSLNLADKSNVTVIREYTFQCGRRIDILINVNDNLVIGLENKIFSNESLNQTKDYANSISIEFPDSEYALFFLTLNGVKADSEDFIPMSYAQLISKLKKVKFDYRDNIRKKVIFDDFILHIEEFMMSKKANKVSDQTRLYLEYRDTIEKLDRFYREDSITIFQEFEGMVKSVFEGEEWVINVKEGRGYQLVYKRKWDIAGLFIHHEFWISNDTILLEPTFFYMIEVEGKQRDIFLTLFNKEHENIKNVYSEKNIEYRPDKRKHAIAFKELDNFFRPDYKIENKLIDVISDWKFIEEAIERAYDEYLSGIK